MIGLGGWWPLWIVLSAGICLFTILIALGNRDYTVSVPSLSSAYRPICVPFTSATTESESYHQALDDYRRAAESEAVRDEHDNLIELRRGELGYRSPEQRGIQKPQLSYEFNCATWLAIVGSMLTALVLCLIIALPGLAARGTYHGFKKSPRL